MLFSSSDVIFPKEVVGTMSKMTARQGLVHLASALRRGANALGAMARSGRASRQRLISPRFSQKRPFDLSQPTDLLSGKFPGADR